MKSTILALAAALAAQEVAGHATFQDLWVNGVDQIGFPFKPSQSTTRLTILARPGLRAPAAVQLPGPECHEQRCPLQR